MATTKDKSAPRSRRVGVMISLVIALALSVIVVFDVIQVAPQWTIYGEMFGIVLAAIAAGMFFFSR